jgi:hypothetical protein
MVKGLNISLKSTTQYFMEIIDGESSKDKEPHPTGVFIKKIKLKPKFSWNIKTSSSNV